MLRPLVAFATLALALTACAAKDATLVLTVHGLSGRIEGSVILLDFDRSRQQVDWANYTAPIPSGHHLVSVDVAGCDGNCENLDAAIQWCSDAVDIPLGGTVAIEITGSDSAAGTCSIHAIHGHPG